MHLGVQWTAGGGSLARLHPFVETLRAGPVLCGATTPPKRAHATKPMALYRTREDDAIAPVLNPRPPDR